ncbi:MAG: hypothetical protein M1135_03260 [Candidatus Omnitrophica bacterium]|nr:hypothetical protein [Candidatus Omnitrophota bacterium]
MTYRVVFWDNRLNINHSIHQKRLIKYLTQNDFQEVNAIALKQWMKERIAKNQAYGSVVVMTMGIAPETIDDHPGKKALWYRYLSKGGRIVWLGDVPFAYAERTDAKPNPVGLPDISILGSDFNGGWGSPYWGDGNRQVTITEEGKKWGFETTDGSIIGYPENAVIIPFSSYDVPGQKVKGTPDFLINISPGMPWGGLIKIEFVFDGNNNAQLRDVWRAANYTGIPVIPPPVPSIKTLSNQGFPFVIDISGSGISGRNEFVRGEIVNIKVEPNKIYRNLSSIQTIQIFLNNGGKTIKSFTKPFADKTVSFSINTSLYAYGKYNLKIEAKNKENKIIAKKKEAIGIHFLPPDNFNFDIWASFGSNPYRRNMKLNNIKKAGFDAIYIPPPSIQDLNSLIKHNMAFILNLAPDRGDYSYKQNPGLFRVDINRKVFSDNGYSGGRPMLGISSPVILNNVRNSLITQYKPVAWYPALRPYILTNDDYSLYYGWDFAKHVEKEFEKKTGLKAPKKMIVPHFGVVPSNNPWVQWCLFSVKDITGRFNKIETQAVKNVRHDTLIGPVPGGMQIPLVQMWTASQYPPYNFGKDGFNLICSYYYNTYWQPILTTAYWMGIGMMGNRHLSEWNMPDCFMTGLYTRNNFFLYLAGGVHGLVYFVYGQRNNSTWPELIHLGKIIKRIGPVQSILWPDQKHDIGLLNSFTDNSFDVGETLTQSYAYDNLIQGHFDVEPVSGEEIVKGRASNYKCILLYDIKYISQPLYKALIRYISQGGLVLLDRTIPFNIPGAKRLNVDIGMGKETTLPFIPNNAVASVPGPNDYGHANRIAVIKKVLSRYIKPSFKSNDIKIGAWWMEADGYPYTYFVNLQNAKEYQFCHERMGAGFPGSGTPEKIKEVENWEKKEIKKDFYKADIILDKLPGVPYDLVSMKPIKTKKLSDGKYEMFLSMERFGGMLVAWLPSKITKVQVNAPEQINPLIPVKIQTEVIGAENKPILNPIDIMFILKNPHGKQVISEVKVTHKGIATFKWTPAINDMTGKWSLQVKELASGKKIRRDIILLSQ